MRWEAKYRPAYFGSVVGQPAAVERLSAMIASDAPRHVLLCGPTGVGKTTLARLFAQALTCARPDNSGSPCHQCDACKRFNAKQLDDYIEVNGAVDGTVDDVRYLLEARLSYQAEIGRRKVVFIDEAARLSLGAKEALLKPLEDFSKEVTFIFSLISRNDLPQAFQDRCAVVELEPRSIEAALRLAAEVAAKEGIATDPDALKLLAYREDSYRRLIGSLEQAAQEGSGQISIGVIRKVLLQSRELKILGYLEHTFVGELKEALAALSSNEFDAAHAVSLIQEILRFLKLAKVGPTIVDQGINPWNLIIPPETAGRVLEELAQRASALGTDPPGLLDEIIEFWSFVPLRLDPIILELHAARFFDLLHVDRPASVAPSNSLEIRRYRELAKGAQSTSASRPEPTWRRIVRTPEDQHQYLSIDQAQLLYEAASFLVQSQGRCFNGLISFHLDPESEATRHAAGLVRQMGQWARRQRPAGKAISWIRLLENLGAGGFHSTIVIHVPLAIIPEFKRWLADFAIRSGLGEKLELECEHLQDPRGAVDRHWELMRKLWLGINPREAVGGKLLVDWLELPVRRRRPAGIVSGHRFAVSGDIGPKTLRAWTDQGNRFFSAWKEGAWPNLFSRWEFSLFQESEERQKTSQKKLMQLEAERSETGDPLHRRNLDAQIRKIEERLSQPEDFGHFPWESDSTSTALL